MMGRTHAAAGAVSLAAIALATNAVAEVPVWCYGVAALAALLPDTDNHGSSLLAHGPLRIVKYMFTPLWSSFRPFWGKANHRGRTHSLIGIGLFMILFGGWLALITAASGGLIRLPLMWLLVAGLAGYTSHIVADLFNLTPVRLLYPLDLPFVFPPWRPLRFGADSLRANLLVTIPLTCFLGWYAIQYRSQLASAGLSDHLLPDVAHWLSSLIHGLISLAKG